MKPRVADADDDDYDEGYDNNQDAEMVFDDDAFENERESG